MSWLKNPHKTAFVFVCHMIFVGLSSVEASSLISQTGASLNKRQKLKENQGLIWALKHQRVGSLHLDETFTIIYSYNPVLAVFEETAKSFSNKRKDEVLRKFIRIKLWAGSFIKSPEDTKELGAYTWMKLLR